MRLVFRQVWMRLALIFGASALVLLVLTATLVAVIPVALMFWLRMVWLALARDIDFMPGGASQKKEARS